MEGRLAFYLHFMCLMITAAVPLMEETFNIHEDIHLRCPYSNMCNKNASLQLRNNNLRPCCESCSCASDCGLYMNCCYENLDTYRLVESLNLVCVNTTSTDEQYYMIDKCLKGYKDVNGVNQCRQTVRETEVVEKLAPVSSLDTHLIYFNADCAKCNGVHEYTSWNNKLDCGISLDGSPTWTLHEGFTGDKICSSTYIPPFSEDWESRKCHTHTIKDVTCKKEYLWLTETCKYLKATYTLEIGFTNVVYENIYCALCSGDVRGQPMDLCAGMSKRGVLFSLKTLIDSSMSKATLKSLLQVYPTRTDQHSEQCLHNEVDDPYKNTCRHLYCPEGMLRIHNECAYFVTQWIVNYYLVQIELRPYPGTQLRTTSIEHISATDRKHPARWMHSRCMDDNWTSVEVFLEVNDINKTEIHEVDINNTEINEVDINNTEINEVQSVIVRLFMNTVNTNGFDPAVIIPHLRDCIRNRWLIEVDGREYPFRANLYKYREYVPDGNMLRHNKITKAYEDVRLKRYESIASGPEDMAFVLRQTKGGIQITKLQFCQQVRLDLSEVEVGSGDIRILSNGMTLGDNEFVIIQGSDNSTTIVVCLEDFNYDAWKKLQPPANDCDKCNRNSVVYFTIFVIHVLCYVVYW